MRIRYGMIWTSSIAMTSLVGLGLRVLLGSENFDVYRYHARTTAPVLWLLRGDFEVFRPAGAIDCTNGRKYHSIEG